MLTILPIDKAEVKDKRYLVDNTVTLIAKENEKELGYISLEVCANKLSCL